MNKERLLKLADHLENGELAHKVFDYSTYNSTPGEYLDINVCGTAGCAIGELPAVWPGVFVWYGSTILKIGNHYSSTGGSARSWFDLNNHEYEFLFIPSELQSMESMAINPLGKTATKEQVAQHIRRFVEHGGIYV